MDASTILSKKAISLIVFIGKMKKVQFFRKSCCCLAKYTKCNHFVDQNIVGSDISVRIVVNQNHYNYKNWTENVVVHYILVNQNVVKLQLVVMVNTL